jgi:adiponectin receptor
MLLILIGLVSKMKTNRYTRIYAKMVVIGNNNDIYTFASNKQTEDAPPYSADGPYIMTGYRAQLNGLDCLKSMFYWHNQTINIWTSIMLMIFNLWLTAHYTTDMPNIFFAFFWLQGILRAICWFNSWAYHTFSCNCEYVAKTLCKADYIGCYLTPLGMGSNIVFIELYCHRIWQVSLLSIGGIAIFAATIVSTMPFYQTEEYRNMRMYLSLFSTLPYLIGLSLTRISPYYPYLLYGFMFEITGGFFYVSFIPEIYFPKRFDCLLSSHNIWHWMNLVLISV